MNIQPISIPIQDDRLSNMTRFFETKYDQQSQVRKEQKAGYCIASDISIKSPALGTVGIYQRDTYEQYGGFTYSAGQITIPKSGWYYRGYMVNWYQENVAMVSMKISQSDKISRSQLAYDRDNYGYCTLGNSDMIRMNQNDIVSVTYDISTATSSYSPNICNTVGYYTQNRLFIFEMPTLSIN